MTTAKELLLDVRVVIEPKDEWEGGGMVCATDINLADVVAHMQDSLSDETKHEFSLSWRVRSLTAQGVEYR